MTIGWYVHHHGLGHQQRFACVAPYLDGVVGLSSLPAPPTHEPAGGPGWLRLTEDVGGDTPDPEANNTLHWAPRHHPGLRARMAAISAWIETAQPRVMVVDVSVEVALLARLHGVPTVLVAQRGTRRDAPHALAYAQAAAVAAPWSAATHVDGQLPTADVRCVGAFSRFDARRFEPTDPGGPVLVLLGGGGHGVTAADLRSACAATPERLWHVAGPLDAAAPNLVCHGTDAPVADLLERCAVVVAGAGMNVVAEVAAARRPLVCLPQARPFGEQEEQARALERLGVAVVCPVWPAAAAWRDVLARAATLPVRRWADLHDGHGAERLAAVVAGVARA